MSSAVRHRLVTREIATEIAPVLAAATLDLTRLVQWFLGSYSTHADAGEQLSRTLDALDNLDAPCLFVIEDVRLQVAELREGPTLEGAANLAAVIADASELLAWRLQVELGD